MIAAESASYPVLGAADAAGVDYGLALRLHQASLGLWTNPSAFVDAFSAVSAAHGRVAADDLVDRLRAARRAERLA